MKKLFSLAFAATLLSFASQATITGSSSVCLGNPGYVTDSLNPGGVWSSSNTAVATIDASGQIFGVTTGSTTISYTYGSPSVIETLAVTVYPAAPPAITGASSVCVGATTTLANSVSGGVWTSSNPSVATVDATTGVVTGVASGYTYIYYAIGGSPCSATLLMHITTNTVTAISGPSSVCAAGGTIILTDSLTGAGTWSSSNPAIASIDPATGVVTGGSVGTVTITYTYTGTCGTASTTKVINVINTTTPGTISGATSVYVGGTASLYETVSGGAWSSSTPSIATVNSSTGVVSGVSAGTVIITYTVTGCGGSASATYTVTSVPSNSISGDVIFSSGGFYGSVKVWLITYNTTTMDLQAVDSISTYCSGMSTHYQFLNVPTDSYRVKAAVYDTLLLTTGYIPTYHTSSFYWNTATVIAHTSGVDDINKDINMMIGTPTTGPGFIGGNVTTGANKGTGTTGIPVEGLSMNIINSLTNQLIQSVRTDASGNYSFSNLPVGTYYVFPDSLNYMTTAYTNIALTASAPVVNTASFIQHTLSKTITPNTSAVSTVNNASYSVIAFPNPASSKLNLQWNVNAAENATVIISDITGREVYKTTMNMNAGAGVKQIDLSSFMNGLYVISVKSATVNYNSKIQVQH